jgi:hypothetical protein
MYDTFQKEVAKITPQKLKNVLRVVRHSLAVLPRAAACSNDTRLQRRSAVHTTSSAAFLTQYLALVGSVTSTFNVQ